MKLNGRIPELAHAVDAAVAARHLPLEATGWRTVVLLEELAGVIGVPRTALRNMYYRDAKRLADELENYVLSNTANLASRIRNHLGKSRGSIVWKRPLDQVKASYKSMDSAIAMAETADAVLRSESEPSITLRREVGGLAAEIMAASLSFYSGRKRWDLLRRAEKVFLNAMSPLSLQVEVDPTDAKLFARFWENRATVCAQEWSTIWDDPNISAPVGLDVVNLATIELQTAVEWEKNTASGERSPRQCSVSSHSRLAQLTGDQASWLIKIGKFEEAARVLDQVGVEYEKSFVESRLLHLGCLRDIHDRKLASAARLANELAELSEDRSGRGSHGHASALMLEHHICLLQDKTPKLPRIVEKFLRESPVAVSDIIDLDRFKKRLLALEYSVVREPTTRHSIN